MKSITAIGVAAFVAATALSPSAGATETGMRTRDCIYDYAFMTEGECRAFRMKLLKAKSREQRNALYDEVRGLSVARAKERGTSPGDWRGLTLAPIAAQTAKRTASANP